MPSPSPTSFSVRFTQAQRRVIAELLPSLTDRLELDKQNRTVRFTLEELQSIQRKANEALPHAENGMKRNSLRHILQTTTQAIEDAQGIAAIPSGQRLYQFRITLQEIAPPVWRRIQVKECTLHRLHEHIQTAMGWTNSHLYRFAVGEEEYADPYLIDGTLDEFGWADARKVKIRHVIPADGNRFPFEYEYDFGDCWLHEIFFEGCLQAEPGGRYPVCLEGARNCPPEDVGGVWGYEEYLKAVTDPHHEGHEDALNWRGSFDPEDFDTDRATKRMRRGLPRWEHW